jgi:hypothetical protein
MSRICLWRSGLNALIQAVRFDPFAAGTPDQKLKVLIPGIENRGLQFAPNLNRAPPIKL